MKAEIVIGSRPSLEFLIRHSGVRPGFFLVIVE
jgi:hypothetical protein